MHWSGLLWVVPAALFYGAFVIYPLGKTIQFSFYDWDGVGVSTPAGLRNYLRVFTEPEMRSSVVHAFALIGFFTVIPVGVSLLVVVLLRDLRAGRLRSVAQTVLFLPQVLPLAAAGIIWQWTYASDGMINGALRAVGLAGLARPWLGDFETALPAVGLIGSWVSLGFCVVLMLAGVGRIDPALFEAARLDGAGRWQEFRAVTLPGLRREIVIACSVTIISALSSFDIVYVATSGGPGYSTIVPGLEIYRLTFVGQQVGAASALAVVLTVLILLIIIPLQRFNQRD